MTTTQEPSTGQQLPFAKSEKRVHAATTKGERFFASPHWVVLALVSTVGSVLVIMDITTSASRSINESSWTSLGYFSVATIVCIITSILAINYLFPSLPNKLKATDDRVLEVYRLPKFLGAIFIGVGITSAIDLSPLDNRIISIWEAFPGVSGVIVFGVLLAVFIVLFVIGNYVSYLFQTLTIQRDSVSQTVTGFLDINDRITSAQLATRRQFSEFIHGEVQGRLLYITSLIRQGKITQPGEIAQHLDELIEKSVRPLAHRMYPSEIVVSVMSALDTLCGDVVSWSASDAFAAIDVVGANRGLNLSQREAIYFVCLEGVNNALKHGVVGTAELLLDVQDNFVTIQITNQTSVTSSMSEPQLHNIASFGLRTIDSWVARSNGKWQLTEHGGSYTLSASVSLEHE